MIANKAASWYQQTDRPAVRFTLEGVPRVGFYQGGQRCPEDVPFPSCMRAVLDHLGEGMGYRLISAHTTTWRLDNTYTFFMGVSGCAFHLSWNAGWREGACDVNQLFSDPAAPYARAIQAAGYGYEWISAEHGMEDEARFRSAVVRSLRYQHRPLIAFGVVGPAEACLVTGYDESGDVLIGWNFFQDQPQYRDELSFEPSGCFRKRNWVAATHGLLLLGEKRKVQPRDAVSRMALQWALQSMRGRAGTEIPSGSQYTGHGAYAAWANDLLLEEAFPSGDLEVLRARFMLHDRAVSTVAEGRWYAARYLEMVVDEHPQVEDQLLSAAECFDTEHDLMWQVWGQVGGNSHSDESVARLADPAVRREIATIIRQAQEQDIRAAGFIQKAIQPLQ